jgi:hypothetical protein
MRGKKTDPIFVSQFISECVKNGLTTPDEIVKRARQQLDQIDLEIKAIENKKKIRGSLLDVILSFEKQTKDKTDEANTLTFYDLANQNDCRYICSMVEFNPMNFDEQRLSQNMCFALKQLIERKIIARDFFTHADIIQGERYDEYIRFTVG